MAKTQPPITFQGAYSETRRRVFAEYELVRKTSDWEIRPAVTEFKEKHFGAEDRQYSLLMDWVRIGRQKRPAAQRSAVMQFVEQNGMPFEKDNMPVSVLDIVRASQYMAFLYDLSSELLEPEPSTGHLIVETTVSDVYAIRVAGSNVFQKTLTKVTRKPEEIRSDLKPSASEKLFLVELDAILRDWVCIEPRKEVPTFFSDSSGAAIYVDPNVSPNLLRWPILNKQQIDWVRTQNNPMAILGRELVRCAFSDARPGLDGLMEGITPSLEWSHPTATSSILMPRMRCKTPWQAICLALFNFASGTSGFKRCPNPRCPVGLYADNHRKDSRNCGTNTACKRWCTRNLKPIRKPKRERRKK